MLRKSQKNKIQAKKKRKNFTQTFATLQRLRFFRGSGDFQKKKKKNSNFQKKKKKKKSRFVNF